jgi:hypothetical protein
MFTKSREHHLDLVTEPRPPCPSETILDTVPLVAGGELETISRLSRRWCGCRIDV